MHNRILIADDHSMIRKGIKLLLQTHLGITEVYEAATGSGVMQELREREYSHIILDIILSDCTCLEIIPNIQQLYPELKIMVFSMLNGAVYGEALKQYKIYYYLEKTSKEEDTISFLDEFINHHKPVPNTSSGQTFINPFNQLSPRELEVLHYMLNGYGTKDISSTLNLRMTTVSTLKNRIFDKTMTSNLKELMQLASLYNVN
ncbi:MAG: response regulator transcription factor [Bacteroidetes bacterium]|nr:response regulator transcription factor [Bacteroidota bacterium]